MERASEEPVCRLVLLQPQPTAQLVQELLLEAAEEHQLQGGDDSGASRQQSPDPPAAASFASAKQLKLALPLAPSSLSPSSSPGIQAVHAPVPHSAGVGGCGSPDGAAQAAPGDASMAPSPDQRGADAHSVEPASLPQSPFASAPAQTAPSSHSTEGVLRPPGAVQQPSAVLTGRPDVAAAAAAAPAPQSSEEDEGADVYAQFGSYEEMVQHFRQLAAQGQGRQEEQPLRGQQELQQRAQQAMGEQGAPGTAADVRPLGGVRTDGDAFMVTTASSFSGECSWWPEGGTLAWPVPCLQGRLACLQHIIYSLGRRRCWLLCISPTLPSLVCSVLLAFVARLLCVPALLLCSASLSLRSPPRALSQTCSA